MGVVGEILLLLFRCNLWTAVWMSAENGDQKEGPGSAGSYFGKAATISGKAR